MLDVTTLQRYMPAFLKNALKPYYRHLFPNQLCMVLLVTVRCNYRCSYCPIVTNFSYANIYGKKQEHSEAEWIAAMDRLPKSNIYISGGEPFLFEGLPELINGLTKHNILGMVTNASQKTELYDRIERRIHLNVSFHREFVREDDFLKKLDELRRIGRFHLNVNLVATRENIPMIAKVEQMLSDHRVSLHVDPYIDPNMQFEYTPEEMAILAPYLPSDRRANLDMLGFDDYAPKECSAGRNYVNIMPDGTVFRCASGFEYFHSPLRRPLLEKGPHAPYNPNFFKMGNLFDPDFRLDTKSVRCELPCIAACDRDMAQIKRVTSK